MLPKNRGSAWRLRCGVVALAMVGPLAIPVTASASDGPGRAGPHVQTFVNQAKAVTRTNGRTAFAMKFQLRQSSASTLNAANSAVALATKCQDCSAIAIGVQVIYVTKQNLSDLNESNISGAENTDCTVQCFAMAEAFQIVFAAGAIQPLTREQLRDMARVKAGFAALRHSVLSPDQIQSQSIALVSEIVSILENNPYIAPASTTPTPASTMATPMAPASTMATPMAPASTTPTPMAPASTTPMLSPAINAAAMPSQLTSDSGPIVDVYRDIHWSSPRRPADATGPPEVRPAVRGSLLYPRAAGRWSDVCRGTGPAPADHPVGSRP